MLLAAGVLALGLTSERHLSAVSSRAAAPVGPQAPSAERADPSRLRTVAAAPLRFGIHPGGNVGMVDERSTAVAERPDIRLKALRRLRGDRDLVLHLYSAWNGTQAHGRELAAAVAEVRAYTAQGFQVEPVIRYRPRRGGGKRTVRAYAAHVRRVVRKLVKNPLVVGVQITNEANVRGAPDAADGAYAGVQEALVAGVVVAATEVRRASRSDLKVGFNWAAAGNIGPDARFWRRLRRVGGRTFGRSVSWVGADIFPGTWSHRGAADAQAAARAMATTLRYLRKVALPQAGLSADVALHISENGFPTGATRDEARQAEMMKAAIVAVDRARARYGVTDYRWFDLRDARTGQRSLEHGYGVLRDDYSPKPGFAVLASLIRRFGR